MSSNRFFLVAAISTAMRLFRRRRGEFSQRTGRGDRRRAVHGERLLPDHRIHRVGE
ncbi:hypothetical protein [Mycobacterium gordonae]|uniref:hypothetical protein n=1 Tax=Mycobacterium gordonae TaxID=1778 RepID=UPI0012EA20DF|nr:hypothetical protein [Mycobacterium gordonae]